MQLYFPFKPGKVHGFKCQINTLALMVKAQQCFPKHDIPAAAVVFPPRGRFLTQVKYCFNTKID